MSISEIKIENFRSIRSLNMKLGKMNAIIGANNSGKSNIIRALNIILGEKWPSQPFFEEDFYMFDTTKKILIEVIFSNPISSLPSYIPGPITGFRLTYDGTETEYLALKSSGEIAMKNGNPIRVTKEMRNDVTLQYLDLERQSNKVVNPSKWTLYGKLLHNIEKGIDEENKENFNSALSNAYETNLKSSLNQLENILKHHVHEQTGLDLKLKLSLFKPLEIISTIRPYLQDTSGTFICDSEDAGAGVQSALSIAIARAYAQIVHKSLTIAIEEPELYLHPHGCRHFYRLLKKFVDEDIQIIYTTHERSFVNLSDFRSIHKVRKINGETIVNSSIDSTLPPSQEIYYASKFDDYLNEIFFSDLVIFVEGFPDKVACKIALEKLGLELDKKNISLVEVDGGGISKILPICEILNEFKIPSIALVDSDPGNPATATQINKLKKETGADSVFEQTPNLEGLLGLSHKYKKYEAMAEFPDWFEKHPIPSVYSDIKQRVNAIIP